MHSITTHAHVFQLLLLFGHELLWTTNAVQVSGDSLRLP
jgi:hypothetical protein